MQCYEAESLLIDYLDAQLHPGDKAPLEKHLAECEQCRKALAEYRSLFAAVESDKAEKPGPLLREKFENMLQSELNIETTSRLLDAGAKENAATTIKRKPSLFLRIAASIILVASGVFIGTAVTGVRETSAEVTGLKNEVKEMRETLLVNLLSEESASERIKAVSYADDIHEPDDKIIKALVTTMNEDRNVNVRLAALYAVARYADNKNVNDALVASLGKQSEPLMQIALINILTEKKETKAKEPILKILKNENTLPPVKEIAEKGLKLL